MEGQKGLNINDDIYEDTLATEDYMQLQKTSSQKITRDDEVKLPVKQAPDLPKPRTEKNKQNEERRSRIEGKNISISRLVLIVIAIVGGVVLVAIGLGIGYFIFNKKGCSNSDCNMGNSRNPLDGMQKSYYVTLIELSSMYAYITSQANSYDAFIPVQISAGSNVVPGTSMSYQMTFPEEESVTWSSTIVSNGLSNRILIDGCDVNVIVQRSVHDTYYAIPECFLGTKYVVLDIESCTTSSNAIPSLYITSGDYNDTVVTLSKANQLSVVSEIRYYINRYQQIILDDIDDSRDYIGMEITSNNPVSLIIYHNFVCLNSTSYGYGVLYEQLLPTNNFGRSFFIPNFAINGTQYTARYAGFIRVVSVEDNTEITFRYNNSLEYYTVNIDAGGYAEKYVTTSASVSCTKPCSVALFWHFLPDTYFIPPSMTIIPGFQLYKTGKTYFSTDMKARYSTYTHLTIVTTDAGMTDVHLNGTLLADWKNFGNEFVFVNVIIEEGGRTALLESSTVPYMAYLYGGQHRANYYSASHPVVLNFT